MGPGEEAPPHGQVRMGWAERPPGGSLLLCFASQTGEWGLLPRVVGVLEGSKLGVVGRGGKTSLAPWGCC